MAEIKQVQKPFDNSQNWLSEHASNVTSQTGEDGIIEKIFEIMGTNEEPWCVEFGAWDGKLYSNSYNLLVNKGWHGVMIEANTEKFGELTTTYQNYPKVHCVNRFVQFQSPDSLDDILNETGIPKDFDFLSIDVDGNDYHIWDSLKEHRPRLIVIEFNPSIPNDIVFIQDPNNDLNHGNSLHAMIELGKAKGYELICTTPWNGFFVPKEYFHLFEIEDNSIYRMYNDQPYGTKLFQLYDGTLLIGGNTQLIWHNIPIAADEIQVIPRSVRRFPDKQ
ncbi:FkbM family methyltransferase [Mariprofundus sp. KV]|uniref:FkbM family methyltransferase n=1 Tax=Mariprofundus sp. KV TaxID=2608715 RepID=UPI0015A05261|nr:FkbM family methyltransferase [Mariprofundus sp. KV]NWF37231.1 FkbM family methyltransferase [Mariprofundus sp. KV]